MPALVVLDTNALLMPFERRIRLEAEIERLLGPFDALVPTACLRELQRIAAQETGGRRDRAKMALQYATRFPTIETPSPADQAALTVARDRHAYLFTNDATLAKQALAQRIPVIRMRGLSHLVVEGPEG